MATHKATIPAKPATGFWTDTGLSLNRGDVVTITADPSSRWALEGRWPGRAGADGFGFDRYRKLYKRGRLKPGPLASAPHAMLIGQIGGGTDPFSPQGVFEVGSRVTFTAGSAGRLYLTCNDDAYVDNTGSIGVKIEVIAVDVNP